MTVDEIRELINLAAETGVAELEVQRGDARVRIRRAGFPSAPQEIVIAPSQAAVAAPVSAPASLPPATEPPREKPVDPNVVLVKAPIVGTFYESPSPDAPPFVSVGERVQPGK